VFEKSDAAINKANAVLHEQKSAFVRFERTGELTPGQNTLRGFKMATMNLGGAFVSGGFVETTEDIANNYNGSWDFVTTQMGQAIMIFDLKGQFDNTKQQYSSSFAWGESVVNTGLAAFIATGFVKSVGAGVMKPASLRPNASFVLNGVLERGFQGVKGFSLQAFDLMSPVGHDLLPMDRVGELYSGAKFTLTKPELQKLGFTSKDLDNVVFDRKTNTLGVNLDSDVPFFRVMDAYQKGHNLNIGSLDPMKADAVFSDAARAQNLAPEAWAQYRGQVNSVLEKRKVLESRQAKDLVARKAQATAHRLNIRELTRIDKMEKGQIQTAHEAKAEIQKAFDRLDETQEGFHVFNQKVNELVSKGTGGRFDNTRGTPPNDPAFAQGTAGSRSVFGKGRDFLRGLFERSEGLGERVRSSRQEFSGELRTDANVEERIAKGREQSETRERASETRERASETRERAVGFLDEKISSLGIQNENTRQALSFERVRAKEADGRATATGRGVAQTRGEIKALKRLGETIDQLAKQFDSKTAIRFSTYILDEEKASSILLKNQKTLESAVRSEKVVFGPEGSDGAGPRSSRILSGLDNEHAVKPNKGAVILSIPAKTPGLEVLAGKIDSMSSQTLGREANLASKLVELITPRYGSYGEPCWSVWK
jgi:hypothetical protein